MAFMLILFTVLSWKIVGPKTRELAASFDALTMPDFLAGRFNNERSTGLLKISSAIVIVLCSFLYLVAIFKGVGHLFSNFFGLTYEQSIFLALAVVVAYTSVGGFLSVVRTDMLQGGMMIIGALMMFFFVTRASGGVGSILELAERQETSFVFDLNGVFHFSCCSGLRSPVLNYWSIRDSLLAFMPSVTAGDKNSAMDLPAWSYDSSALLVSNRYIRPFFNC